MERLTNDWKVSVISGAVCLGAILTACANGPTPHRPASAPPVPRLSQYDTCVRDTHRIGAGGDLCEPFENDHGQFAWDAGMRDGGWKSIRADRTPLDRCRDTWAYVGPTTYYVCWDGRVTTS